MAKEKDLASYVAVYGSVGLAKADLDAIEQPVVRGRPSGIVAGPA